LFGSSEILQIDKIRGRVEILLQCVLTKAFGFQDCSSQGLSPARDKGAGQRSSSGLLSKAFYFPESLIETGNHNLNRGFKQLPLVPLDTIEPTAAPKRKASGSMTACVATLEGNAHLSPSLRVIFH